MPTYTFGPFSLNCEARTLLRDGEPVSLTGKTFDTLLLLIQNRGKLLTKDELLAGVWRSTNVEEANLTQSIFSVRKVLGDRPKDHRFIATVPGCGYQFVAPVTEVVATSQAVPVQSDQTQISSRHPPQRSPLRWLSGVAFCAVAALVVISSYNSPGQNPLLATAVQLTNDGKTKNELVTDGVRIFYAAPKQLNLSHWQTYEVSINGGESRRFPLIGQEMSPLDISPDHTELLLAPSEIRESGDGWITPGQLWFQPLLGGPPKISALRAYDAAWSPNGGQIVYAVGQQIGLAQKDGTPGRKLADLPGVASGLRWSPGADKIRFTLHYGIALKDSSIWEVSPQAGKAHPLFPGLKKEQGDGQWTPNGRYYLFSRIDKGVSQIWALPERRSWFGKSAQLPVQLITGPMQCFLPTPSPDGKRLLFYGTLEGTLLLKYDRASSRFEPFLPGISGEHLDFSKDGKWVTYSSFPEHALWRAAADGTQRLQLSPPDMLAMLPVISPDGARIAFVGAEAGQPSSIFVVGRDGGALKTIVSTEPIGLVEPAWSPDSASLVLGTFTGKSPLYRFDFADSRLAALPGSEGLGGPRWSPDGRSIVAIGPLSALMLYDLKSHRQTKLVDPTSFSPVWAHDGQYIYFGRGNQDAAWYRVRIRDRKLERIVSLADSGALPSKPSRGIPTWNYCWTGLAPEDSLLTAREAGSIELYSADWVQR